MTCLLPPAAPQPEESGAAAEQGQDLAPSLIGTALQQLRHLWREQGFDDAVLLAGGDLQASLCSLWAAQKRELLVALLGLWEDPALCRPLQEALTSGGADPAAGRSVLRNLQQLQPMLTVWPMLHCYGASHGSGSEMRGPVVVSPRASSAAEAPGQLLSDPNPQTSDLWMLGISLRALGSLRRGPSHPIRQLAGVSEEQLAGIRGMGAVGIEELRNALQQQGLALPFSLQEHRAVATGRPETPQTMAKRAPPQRRSHPGAQGRSGALPVMPSAIVSCALSRRPRSMWLRISAGPRGSRPWSTAPGPSWWMGPSRTTTPLRSSPWTEARLQDLLAQSAAPAGLPADAMPDRPQLAAFLSSGVVPEYLDKQAITVCAALSRQFRISWQQVAERFGRRIIH